MSEDTATMSKAAFAAAFSELSSAILNEWESVNEESLAATGGELDKVVTLVADRTSHTKAWARRQLEELYGIVMQPSVDASTKKRSPHRRTAAAGGEPALDHLLEDLERRTAHIIRELRGGFMEGARDRVRENIWFSLLVAIGAGFIVGVLFTGFNRGK